MAVTYHALPVTHHLPLMPAAPKSEFRALTAIAVPVVIVQVGMMLMGVVDTIVVGHVSRDALAAAALGNIYFWNAVVVAVGALMVLDPLVSQALGAGDDVAITRAIQRGLVLSVVLGVITTLLMLPAAPVLRAFRQPPEVIPGAATVIHISAIGTIPLLGFTVLRQSLQALHRNASIVTTIIIANAINALLNWVLVFGHWGAPPMGLAGSAWATLISRYAMLVALFALSWKDLRPYLHKIDPASLAWRPQWRMLLLGLPIGFQQLLEYSAFAAVGLMMGTFGATQVAAHQIALNLAALTFMVPLGVSAAAAVRVGHAVGAGDMARSRRAARLSFYLGVGFMAFTALLFLSLPGGLARLYSVDRNVVAIAAALIPVAGVFQVADGLQAVGAGVLRGLGDARVPLVAMLTGYWLIGVPVSLWLGFRTSLGPTGLWWGFVAGLASVGIFLLWRVRVLFRGGVSRIHLDAPASASMA
jgi:multidrug resistance protein, MATE family